MRGEDGGDRVHPPGEGLAEDEQAELADESANASAMTRLMKKFSRKAKKHEMQQQSLKQGVCTQEMRAKMMRLRVRVKGVLEGLNASECPIPILNFLRSLTANGQFFPDNFLLTYEEKGEEFLKV